ncbi:MAG: hypothetical protein OEU44_08845, partial [Gammaproteobacteria bacterium]|nr:hypothetical protein [Gammaproteobacteria bacterium]
YEFDGHDLAVFAHPTGLCSSTSALQARMRYVGWAKRSVPNIEVIHVGHVAMLLCPTYDLKRRSHPRESGDPDTSLSQITGVLDSRFRGNDGKGGINNANE